MVGGRLMYETLYANMPSSLQSLSNVKKYVQNSFHIVEGKMKFEELQENLNKRQYNCYNKKYIGWFFSLVKEL